MISAARKWVRGLCFILAKPFVALGIHPNIVSSLAVPLALAYAFFVLQQRFLLAFLFALLSMSMDIIDGTVADMLKKRTLFGNYFETMVDKVVDFIFLGVFVFWFPLATMLAVGFSFLSSYAKPRVALVIITDNRDWPAIGEHGDKIFILLAGLLISAFLPNVFGQPTMELTLYLIALISAIGAVQRITYGKKLIAEAERKGTVLPYLKKYVR